MKKFKLKKQYTESSQNAQSAKSYKINYATELNQSQFDAVMHRDGAALVIAGAGTGKTRTIVYRVARLIEDGTPPENILLLTFTRKAASEMLRRASLLLDSRAEKVNGGTFHSFAMNVLRRYAKAIGYDPQFTILDKSDSEDVINLLRNQLVAGKKTKRFPHKATLTTIFSLAVNTQNKIEDYVEENYPHLLTSLDEIVFLSQEYIRYKKRYNLMDYDDLLLNLLRLLKENPKIRAEMNLIYKQIMVDEYQDSNRLQHEIVLQLAGDHRNLMAVGDDAQSIYAFRGANFQNIMYFPESFDKCKIYKIEENYRSTQQILKVSNKIIEEALFKYEKELYSEKNSEQKPIVVSCGAERIQSQFLVQQILEHYEEGYSFSDMAVLFRNSFHSFDLEIEMEKADIPYKKFGGIRFIETAHIKDILAYLRVMYNPKDAVSWQRILLLLNGVGSKTASDLVNMIADEKLSIENTIEITKYKKEIKDLFEYLSDLSKGKENIADKVAAIADYYKPLLKEKHDDWNKRWRDVETFITIAERYNTIPALLNDMAIEPPNESVAELNAESKEDEFVSLSTIHSAKGLEWRLVFIIWALEGKFPSAKAAGKIDDIEEERRLFYVAVTRAKDLLYISYPTNIFDRESGIVLSEPSRFIKGIGEEIADIYVVQVEDDTE